MSAADPRIPYPDAFDWRQAMRSGAAWPRHKARARGKARRRSRIDAERKLSDA